MPIHMFRELDNIKKDIYELCTLVEDNLKNAIKAIVEKDEELANKVIETDTVIDRKEIEVEESCLKVLALYHPVATDLRFIISALKINNDLERVGDMAVNIAERTHLVSQYAHVVLHFDFTAMFTKSMNMIKKSIDAYMNADLPMCEEVRRADDEIDTLNRSMYSIFKKEVQNHPELIDIMLQYLSISRYLERIADHATNIAEDVIYMISGTIIRHEHSLIKNNE